MDGDELDAATDPGDPNDTPSLASIDGPVEGRSLMLGARPNPFRGGTQIRFDLPAAGHVQLEVFDVQGRRVKTLASGTMPAGRHTAAWDGRDDSGRRLATGVYFVKLDAGVFREVRKIVRLD